jgi:hypothetical protein
MNHGLADFDNHLMNGLDFCKKAYSLFEEIRMSPNGVETLRLRKGRLEKKLLEELLPIARYIQARYSHGRQLRKSGTATNCFSKFYIHESKRRKNAQECCRTSLVFQARLKRGD